MAELVPNTHVSLLLLPVPGAVSPSLDPKDVWDMYCGYSWSSQQGSLSSHPQGIHPRAFTHEAGLDLNAVAPMCFPDRSIHQALGRACCSPHVVSPLHFLQLQKPLL